MERPPKSPAQATGWYAKALLSQYAVQTESTVENCAQARQLLCWQVILVTDKTDMREILPSSEIVYSRATDWAALAATVNAL
jgi:hypothetical protein